MVEKFFDCIIIFINAGQVCVLQNDVAIAQRNLKFRCF